MDDSKSEDVFKFICINASSTQHKNSISESIKMPWRNDTHNTLIYRVTCYRIRWTDVNHTGRSAITWLIELQAAAVAPVCMAFMDTSIRKKYTTGMGSRTWLKINIAINCILSKPCSDIMREISSINRIFTTKIQYRDREIRSMENKYNYSRC